MKSANSEASATTSKSKGAPYQEGFKFFQLETSFDGDKKLRQVQLRHPSKGFEVYVKLLAAIYGEWGYFMQWNMKQCLELSEQCVVPREQIEPIVQSCIKEGLFSAEIFTQYSILTSTKIQEKFLYMAKRRKRICILRDFSIFNTDLIGEYKIEAKTFYRDISSKELFDRDGSINPEWVRLCTTTLVTEDRSYKPPPMEDPNPEKTYGSAPPNQPPGFNWEAEKKLMESDEEWKFNICRDYSIGQWEGRVFTADQVKLQGWFEMFYKQLAGTAEQQTAAGMKRYFYFWISKRVAGGTTAKIIRSSFNSGENQDLSGSTSF